MGSREYYRFESQPEFEEVNLKSSITGRVEVMRIERGLNVKLEKTRLKVELTCYKCLKPYNYDVLIPFGERQFYFFPEDLEADPFENFLIDKKNQTIDVSDMLRQEIILHFPIIQVCSTGCKGTCAHCGKNRNIETCDCKDESAQEEKPLSKLKDLIK